MGYAYVRFMLANGDPIRTPFERGGEGFYFIYLTNRNVCSALFPAVPMDEAFITALHRKFEMGYSRLYVLEKWYMLVPGDEPATPDIPSRISLLDGYPFAVFHDPARTPLGSSALAAGHDNDLYNDVHACITAVRTFVAAHGKPAVAVRIVDSIDWH